MLYTLDGMVFNDFLPPSCTLYITLHMRLMNDAYLEGIMYLVNNVHLSKVHLTTIVYSVRQNSPLTSVQAHHYQNATKVNASLYKYE